MRVVLREGERLAVKIPQAAQIIPQDLRFFVSEPQALEEVLQMAASAEVTRLLLNWSEGDKAALDQLMPLVYDELHRLAEHYMVRERQDHTLQPTALVHEAYMRLVDQSRTKWQSRAHFFSVAALLMRRIVVKYARSHHTAKRGGGAVKLVLDEELGLTDQKASDLVALDDALKSLEAVDPQQSRLVELRFFGGLTLEETAAVLGISTATVKREWRTVKAWLQSEIQGLSNDGS